MAHPYCLPYPAPSVYDKDMSPTAAAADNSATATHTGAPPRRSDHYAALLAPILDRYPQTEAVYLYGSWGSAAHRPQSDIDIALLLPLQQARNTDEYEWTAVAEAVARAAGVERCDLINLHSASTILRKEVIAAEQRIHCADRYAADTFEMLTLSLYQKLNQERQEIVRDGQHGGFYHV